MAKTEYTMREIQMTTLECLKEVKRICEKNDIPYFLSWGSALGAVRHEGFIPWDDDIDISMLYPDYLRFLEICQKDLDTKRFFLQTPDTDYNTFSGFAKIRMNHTTSMIEEYSHIKMHWGICMDIFPIRNAPQSSLKRKQLIFLSKLYRMLLKRKVLSGRNKLLIDILCGLFTEKGLRKKLEKRIDAFCPAQETQEVFDIEGIPVQKAFYPRKLIEGSMMLKFEDTEFPCPKDVDAYLTYMYGDYMTLPPEQERIGHTGALIDIKKDYTEYQQ